MSQPLTCRRCEHTGYDVDNRIVVNPDPHPVTYSGLDYAVPERFRREARCIDQTACDDRLDLLEGEPA